MPPARPTYQELVERIEALEARSTAKYDLKQFPMQALQAKLATDLQPDGDTFILPKSVGPDSLEDDAITAAVLADNSVTSAHIVDGTIMNADIAAGQISNAQLAGGITDAKLASPNNHIWRTILFGVGGGASGATIFAWAPSLGWVTPGGASGNNSHISIYRYVPADHDINGYTTQIRVSGVYASNATAAARNFPVGAYELGGAAGGAGVMSFSSMAAVHTHTITAPAASTITPYQSTPVAAPAAATNLNIGTVPSGAVTAGHLGLLSCSIEIGHV